MSEGLLAQCPQGRDLVSLSPSDSASCTGGATNDGDTGRFGSSFRDDAIAVFRRMR